MRIPLFLAFSLLAFGISGCVSVKELSYFHDLPDEDVDYALPHPQQSVIKPKDDLYIRVSSFDEVSYNFFSSQQNLNNSSFQNEQSIALSSYAVNDSGLIYFPILGEVSLLGLTESQASLQLQKLLSEYFNQPTVIVKLVNKKITILGEVMRPGSYIYTKERLNIFEALGMAGDISQFGNREKAVLLREQDGKLLKRTINLNSVNIFSDQDFFVKQDDIIYITPQGTRRWSSSSTPWALTLTTITTIVLVLSYINQF